MEILPNKIQQFSEFFFFFNKNLLYFHIGLVELYFWQLHNLLNALIMKKKNRIVPEKVTVMVIMNINKKM